MINPDLPPSKIKKEMQNALKWVIVKAQEMF